MKKKTFFAKLSIFIVSLFLFAGTFKNITVSSNDVIAYADEEDEELERRKQEAIEEVQNCLDLNDFDESTRKIILKHMNEACTKISLISDDINLIEYYLDAFYTSVQYYIGPIDRPTDSLEDAKDNALEYIDSYLFRSEAYPVFQQEIDDFVRNIKNDIELASSIEEVNECLDAFKEKMDEYPSNVEIYLNELRYNLVEDFIDYIGELLWEYGPFISDADVDYFIEDFENKISHCSTYEQIIEEYNYSKSELYYLATADSMSGSVPSNDTKNNSNVGLIIACSIEGFIILLGAISGALYFMKKKKA